VAKKKRRNRSKNKYKKKEVKKETLEWSEENIFKTIVDITKTMELDNKDVVTMISKITRYTGSLNQLQYLHKMGKEKVFKNINKLLENH